LTVQFHRIVFQSAKARNMPDGLTVLATTPGLAPAEAAVWRAIASVQPFARPDDDDGRAFGLFAGPGGSPAPGDLFGLMCAYAPTDAYPAGVVECVLVPRFLLTRAGGNIAALIAGFRDPYATPYGVAETGAHLTPWAVTPGAAWSPKARAAAFTYLLHAVGGEPDLAFERVCTLLAAALHERGAIVYGFEESSELRLRIIQGLMALLPAPLRADFTFSTNRHEAMPSQARFVFAARHVVSTRWPVSWDEGAYPAEGEVGASAALYLSVLRAAWQDARSPGGAPDVGLWIEQLEPLDRLAEMLRDAERPLSTRLGITAERWRIEQAEQGGRAPQPNSLKAVLAHMTAAPADALRWASALAEHALRARDDEAAARVAASMDADPALDAALWALLNGRLLRQPDAVYAFVRAHLAAETRPEADSARQREWLFRLHAAALAALRVVIRRGDPEPLIAWLKLIAREPADYALAPILHDGILAAQAVTHERAQRAGCGEEPALARALALLAVRRDPAAAVSLFSDDLLVNALPPPIHDALHTYSGDPAALLNTYGPDLLMFVLARAAKARQPGLFTPYAVERVLEFIAAHHTGDGLSPTCGAAALDIDRLWREDGIAWMHDDAIAHLLALTLPHGDFLPLARTLPNAEQRARVVRLLVEDGPRQQPAAVLIGWLLRRGGAGDLTAQESFDAAEHLIARVGLAALPAETCTAVMRFIHQHPAIAVDPALLWPLLRAARAADDEAAVRALTRRIELHIEAQADDAEVLALLARLIDTLDADEDDDLTALLVSWWRGLVRAQPTARLFRWEKLLDGSREPAARDGGRDAGRENRDRDRDRDRDLEPFRTVVTSAAAFRRLLGKRSLAQFAADVDIAFDVLASLEEAYEPLSKRGGAFDSATVRAEIDARRDELSPHTLQIFASNLKALAERIADLGDARSKAGLIRRGEDVDRQLTTGEQTPHSAVDTLKWMSGYLSGAQEPDRED
jgi:hypothetical protein